MIGRLVLQTLAWCRLLGLLLFASAGTVRWSGAWALLIEIAFGSLALGLWLARRDHGLLSERLSSPVRRDQKDWDKVFLGVFVLGFCGWLVLMGIDSVRFHWSEVPTSLRLVGAVGPVMTYLITWQAFKANSYASPVVRLQEDRAQELADTGPYRVVRHPMYSGALPFIFGAPLMLGSWWGLAAALALAVALAIRAVLEERTLIAELPGYASYAQRVRFRLIPGIW